MAISVLAASELKIDVIVPVDCERKTEKGDKIDVHYCGTPQSNGQRTLLHIPQPYFGASFISNMVSFAAKVRDALSASSWMSGRPTQSRYSWGWSRHILVEANETTLIIKPSYVVPTFLMIRRQRGMNARKLDQHYEGGPFLSTSGWQLCLLVTSE